VEFVTVSLQGGGTRQGWLPHQHARYVIGQTGARYTFEGEVVRVVNPPAMSDAARKRLGSQA
jgi:hypothetical protein